MTALADPVRSLEGAILAVADKVKTSSDPVYWAGILAFLRRQLELARTPVDRLTVADLAFRADVTDQTIRNRLTKRHPEAKVGGRWLITSDIVPDLLRP